MSGETTVASFTDRRDREWTIVLDVAICRDVKAQLGVDLANWSDGKASAKLWSDDGALVDVLWLLLKEQATELGVDEREFAKSLNGDVLAAGLKAIEDAVVNFTRPDRLDLVRKIAEKSGQVTTAAIERASQEIDAAVTPTRLNSLLDKTAAKARKAMDRAIETQ